MAIDKNFTMSRIVLSDGASTPNTLEVDTDIGNLKCGPFMRELNEIHASERKGKVRSLAPGKRVFQEMSFQAKVAKFTDASEDIVTDFLLQQGKFDGNVSVEGADAPVYTINVAVYLEGTDYGEASDPNFTASRVRPSVPEFSEEEEADLISVMGTIYGGTGGDLVSAEIS